MTKPNFSNVSNEDNLQWKLTSNGRLPQISKMKYLSHYWSDLPHILNLGLCDQSKLYKCFKWIQTPMEDDLKWKCTSNIKSEISQQLLFRSSSNLRLRLMWPKQTLQMVQMKRLPMEEEMEDYLKSDISQKLLVGSSPNFELKLMWPN